MSCSRPGQCWYRVFIGDAALAQLVFSWKVTFTFADTVEWNSLSFRITGQEHHAPWRSSNMISLFFPSCSQLREGVAYIAELFLLKSYRPNFFEIIINVLIRNFRLIWIPVLWDQNQYQYFNCFSAGIFFIRQNLTSTESQIAHAKILKLSTISHLTEHSAACTRNIS